MPIGIDVKLSFLCPKRKLSKTSSKDFTNLSQEIVDAFDQLFYGRKMPPILFLAWLRTLFSGSLNSVFGSSMPETKRGLVSAIEHHMDYLLFWMTMNIYGCHQHKDLPVERSTCIFVTLERNRPC